MDLVDIHCHLEHPRFSKDLLKVIEKAKREGVVKIITSGTTPSTNRESLRLANKYDFIFPSFGIFPLDVLASQADLRDSELDSQRLEKFNLKEELKWIHKNKDKCVAIGECGLDYKYIEEEGLKEKQKEVFREVIGLANRIKKPLLVHSRKADKDALDILDKESKTKVVLHCFHGNKKLVERGSNRGYFFSIPPIIKRSKHFQMLASIVPLSQILTETDSPFLSSNKGKRNEPKEVKVTIREIAKIKEKPTREVVEQIYKNFESIFIG